jgi:hypothetical protein
MGKAMEGILSVFAELDNNNRRERSKEGMVKRVQEGIWVWPAPLGYYKPIQGKSTNLIPDPEKAVFIKTIFEEYSKGIYTYKALAALIGRQGLRTKEGRPPSPQLIDKILRNPIYHGQIDAFGEIHHGAFTPIISEALFLKCQEINTSEKGHCSPRSSTNPLFPLRKFVRCTKCGALLTGSSSVGKKGKKYPYYHHGNQKCEASKSIPKEAFEQQFVELLDGVTPGPRYERIFRDTVIEVWKERYKAFDLHNRKIDKEVEKLCVGRQRVFDLHLQGIYSDEEFHQQKDQINKTIEEKRRALKDSNLGELEMEKALDYCFKFVRTASKTWLESSHERRIQLQKLILEKPLDFDGEKFGTPELSLVFETKKNPSPDSSSLVAPRGIEPLLTA